MTAPVIADDYLNEAVLPKSDENIQRFWKEFATSDKDVASLVATWNASPDAKKAVVDQTKLIETLRQLRATIIAFEDAREPPEKVAEFFAAQRLSREGREELTRQFLTEVSDRRKNGVPIYGATLQAAQAIQNHLDELAGSGARPLQPEDTYRMWWWDAYLRQKFVSAKVETLLAMGNGKAYLNDYLIIRTTTIKCVGAKLGPDAGEIIARLIFPTEGYSNPAFFRAIYEGRTQGMRVSQVGYYLTAFFSMFTNAEDDAAECRNVVSKTTLLRIGGAGSADALKQVLGGLVQAHRQGDGISAGFETFGGMMLSEASAKADAQLFYDRHGCQSPVANRFFSNISDFAKKE
jgi:hypothetical protein